MGNLQKYKIRVFGRVTFSEFKHSKVLVKIFFFKVFFAGQSKKYLPWHSVDKQVLNPGVTQKHSA